MMGHSYRDETGESVHESAAIDADDAAMFAADTRRHAGTPYSAAEMLTLLQAMTADLPQRPDARSTAQIEHESALEQLAEDRAYNKAHPSDREQDWLERRRAG